MGFHDDILGDSTSVHHSTFGDDVDYAPPGESDITLTNVIVGHEFNTRRYYEGGYEYVQERSFEIVTDEDSETYSGASSITPNGTITYGGTKYGIERVSEKTEAGTSVAFCIRRNPGKRTREGLRGR